jgi:O-antigen biosynthesis protein WbqP
MIAVFILLAPVMLLIAISVRLSSKGPFLYWSDRVSKDNIIFRMPKFQSILIRNAVLNRELNF